MKNLLVKNLHVSIDKKAILNGLNLKIGRGEIHTIMGPNGAGKSTLAKVLMGDQNYEVLEKKDSVVQMNGENLLIMEPNERAESGLFLSFQNPVEIPGVRVETFLREAYRIRFKNSSNLIKKALDFRKYITGLAKELEINPILLRRGLNENFSGGEKKRLEILQMILLKPQFAILDETDSGLDIDALKIISRGIKHTIKENNTGVILITHYQRILQYLKPDFVHIMVKGKIVKVGGSDLVDDIEKNGYKQWT
jgi:Fe-S cluster assembly ATP-binding protein